MTLSVADVVNQARDAHAALSPTNAPQPIAIRRLTLFQRTLVTEIVRRVPGFLAQTVTVNLPLTDFDAGIDLSSTIASGWLDLPDGVFTYAQSPSPSRSVPGTFVPFEQRMFQGARPAFTFLNNVLYFIGLATEYTQYASFTLSFTSLPSALVDGNSTFILPDDALECLAAELAAVWIQRLVGNPNFDVDGDAAAALRADANRTKAEFLTRIFRLTQRQSYRVRDRQPGGGY